MDPFDFIFDRTLCHEGALSLVASDPGNWTGGAVGRGTLRGSKYGISAAAFPFVDIAALTPDAAKAIARTQYYDKAGCSRLPGPLALLVFDSAYNNGVSRAVKLLQRAVLAVPDGMPGTGTFAAVRVMLTQPNGLENTCTEFQAQRLLFMASLPTWPTFGLGWARRLCRLPFQATRLPAAFPPSLAA